MDCPKTFREIALERFDLFYCYNVDKHHKLGVFISYIWTIAPVYLDHVSEKISTLLPFLLQILLQSD